LVIPSTKRSSRRVDAISGRQVPSSREVMHETNSPAIISSTAPESVSWFKRSGKKTWTGLWKLTPTKKKHPLASASEESDGSTHSSPKLHDTPTPINIKEVSGAETGDSDDNESRRRDVMIPKKLSNSPSQEMQRLDHAIEPTTADHVTSPSIESSRFGTKLSVDGMEGGVRKDHQDSLLNAREKELEQLTVHCDDIIGQFTENTNELDKRITNLKEIFEDSTTSCELYHEELKRHAKQALKDINQVDFETTQHQLDFDRMGDRLEQSQEKLEKAGQQINVWHDRINGLHLELRFFQWQMKRSRLRDMFYVVLSWIFQFVAFMYWLSTKVYTIIRRMLVSMFPALLNENDRRRQLQRRLRRMSSSLQPEEWARRLKGYFEKQELTTTTTTTHPKQDVWEPSTSSSSSLVTESPDDQRRPS
jgi:hypothetical protein